MNNNKEIKVENKKNKLSNLVLGKGINLIPPKTDVEIVTEEVKGKVNLSAAISILILVVGTLLIVGYNAFSKINLSNNKKELQTLEMSIENKKDIMISNEELIRKAVLYKDVEESTVSYKQIIDFWESVTGNLAQMDSIDISSSLKFKITGTSGSLDSTSKLWYILANDTRIQNIVLKSISKDTTGVRFSFEGDLTQDIFNNTQSAQ